MDNFKRFVELNREKLYTNSVIVMHGLRIKLLHRKM